MSTGIQVILIVKKDVLLRSSYQVMHLLGHVSLLSDSLLDFDLESSDSVSTAQYGHIKK